MNELKNTKQWICHLNKIPKSPLYNGNASPTDPHTWGTYEQAVNACKEYGYSGIGFVFTADSPYCGIDIDHCIDENGEIHKNALDIISTMDSYTEISPSGTGVHIIYKGQVHEDWKKKKTNAVAKGSHLEMYQYGRYFTVTGNRLNDKDIESREPHAALIYQAYMTDGQTGQETVSEPSELPKPQSLTMTDKEIIDRAMNSSNGMKFARLFNGDTSDYDNDDSRADMAFCVMLAFWCRKDMAMMDRIFRQSRLMRDKWDKKHGRDTYGNITLQKAVEQCGEVYEPKRKDADFDIMIENTAPKTAYQKLYSFDDTGNAERLKDLYGKIIRYNFDDKCWMVYRRNKWEYDTLGIIMKLIDRSVESMTAERQYYEQQDNQNGDDSQTKAFDKHYKKSRSNNAKNALDKQTRHTVAINHSHFDNAKMALNTENGVVNLQTFECRPAVPEDYFTKSAAAKYNPSAKCPSWIKFLHEIFDNDENLIEYVQKAVGYSLTGSTAEQCVFFLYGTGRNGKSTFIDIIREIAGDYARNIQPETIMVRNNNNINSDIARLAGARFVTSVEPNEGMRINEGLLKQLTGGDATTARKLYGNEFEFYPEFKLWMSTNHKPVIRGTDLGIWRRIHLIPFTVTIPESEVDTGLKDKLLAEKDGILTWILQGTAAYLENGLSMPNAVRQAVDEYKKEMDVVTRFLEECTEKAYAKSVKASDLYRIYTEWCRNNGEYQMSNTKFGKEISQKYERVKKMDGWYYIGIQFNDDYKPYSVTITG